MARYFHTGAFAGIASNHLAQIDTALLACGWTVWDSPGTFGQKIYRSPDVNGVSGVFFFIWVADVGSMGFAACVDWDPVTHTAALTGINATGGGAGANAGTGYLYANQLGFTYYVDGGFKTGIWVGQPRTRETPGVTDGLCLSTAPMSVGATSVAVSQDLRGRLFVGQKVVLQNFSHNSASANWANTEGVTITAVGASTLSFTATTKAYDTGAKIGPPSMLWPICGVAQSWATYGGGVLQPAIQSVGQRDNPTGGTGQNVCFSPYMTYATSAPSSDMNNSLTEGQGGEAFPPFACSLDISDKGSMQPVWGWLMVPKALHGTAGDKFTDGTDVYVLPTSDAVSGSGPYLLFGPTGGTPDFSTMTRIRPPIVPMSDSIYANPPVAPVLHAPPNGLNQGLT